MTSEPRKPDRLIDADKFGLKRLTGIKLYPPSHPISKPAPKPRPSSDGKR